MADDQARTRSGPGRALLQRRGLRVWLVLLLAMASVAVVGATVPLSSHTSTAGAVSACTPDSTGGCQVTLPCPPGQTTDCPTVDVTPNTDLTDGQYVRISTTHMDPTGSIRVAFCSADSSSTDPSCLSGPWENQTLRPVTVPVIQNSATANLTTVSYPVFLDPAGEGNSLVPAYDIQNHGAVAGFNCDDAADPCVIVVTEEPGQGPAAGAGPTVTPANSAVVPLTFASQSNGCPSSDPQLQVESSFSVQNFIPAAVQATCTKAGGVVGLDSATDDGTVIKDFASGVTPLAFVSDAADPVQLAYALGKGYAFIPVALSGTAESFLAGASSGSNVFPIDTYKLTPNMVAGLLTTNYQSATGNISFHPPGYVGSDNVAAALATATPVVTCDTTGTDTLAGCPKAKSEQLDFEQQYTSFDLLNPEPTGDYAPQTFGSFNANVPSGSSFQATQWLCDAPNAPITVPVSVVQPGSSTPTTVPVTVQDPNTASSDLVNQPQSSTVWSTSNGYPWAFPSCQGYSTLPAFAGLATNYGEYQSPLGQSAGMRKWCYGGGVLPQPPSPQNPCAAFGLMDTSEAAFYGLSTAQIQNAAGNFVAPTTASLEAAAKEFSPCPAQDLACPSGTYATDYDDASNTAAYAMPTLTYAVVPTTSLANDEGTEIKDLLTNLVTFAHTGSLPQGYAPLPDSIYTAAMNDITNDLHIAPVPTTTTTPSAAAASTTGSSGSSTSYGSSGSGSDSGTSDLGTGFQTSSLPLTTGGSGSSGGGHSSASTPVAAPPASIPSGFLLVGLSDTTRYLLPALVVLLLGSLIGGLLLLFGPGASTRRRRDETGGAS